MIRSVACALLLAAQAAVAAAPVITELKPRGAEIGRAFILTAIGRNLGEGAHIVSTLPASFTLVLPPAAPGSMAGPMTPAGRSASFLVEPKADAAPGVYPIRIESSGISNVLLFTLGTFPEVTEEESQPGSLPHRNDTIETAEPVRAAPVVVNGTLVGPERDVYRVSGKAGERRVFELEARRSGSAIDPVLRILDGSGKQLARNDDAPGAGLDARLDFTFPFEGNYYVEITDARFSTQAQNFYRLKMGAYHYADGIFPLGGRRGEHVPVTFFGGNLSAGVASTADLTTAGKTEAFAHVALPDSPVLPFVFAVSDLPELMEPVAGDAPIPGVVNGRLDRAGEIDRYHFRVEPGEKLIFELQARELGTSRLEAILKVSDAAGKKLASAGDQPLPEDVFAVQGSSRTSSDPFLNLTVPADVHEVVVSVEDLALRGGPLYGYRLIARRQAEDDRMVRELLTASGSSYENPAANFYRVTRDPKPTMEKTTQVFLGVRMVCTQCHDHPFERWTQNQYYEMAAFFSAVGLRPGYEVGEEILYDQRQDYDMKHPKDGRVMNPKFIVPASWSSAAKPTDGPPTDAHRRQAYAEWVTARDNPFFAKSTVNRVWSYFFGRGIIDPVDDIRASNPPSNPALLDALAKDFVDHNFDLRYLMRTIANSRTYQASVAANEWNEKDADNFSHAMPRRLSAEELMDALALATGVRPVFPEAPPDTRAEQVTDPHVGQDGFLDLFGRPARESACECERRADLSLPQALNLVNGKTISDAVADSAGRVAKAILSGRPDREIVMEMYLASLSRPPRAAELESGIGYLSHEGAAGRAARAQDLLWALVNSKAFLYNY